MEELEFEPPQEAPAPAAAAPAGPAAPGQASPQQQKAFEMLAKHALAMLLSEEGSEMVLAVAKTEGPEKAVAEAVTKILQASLQAAEAAGVQVDDATVNAAAQPGIALLLQGLAEAGYVRDPRAAAQAALRMVDEAIQIPGAAGAEASAGPQEPPPPPGAEQEPPPEEEAVVLDGSEEF